MKLGGYAAAVVAAAALGAACGGSGGDGLSREELASRADEICARYEKELNALAEPSSIEEVKQLADEAKPVIERGVNELDDLQPPDDLQEDYDRWIELNRENLDVVDKLGAAAQDGDVQRVQEILQEAQAKEAEADRLAGELGLTDCAND